MLAFLRDILAIVQNLGLTEDQMKAPPDNIAAMHQYVDGHMNEMVEHETSEDVDSKQERHLMAI